MDLTVSIVNWNGQALLSKCLASVRSSTGSRHIQVVVVDNASKDGSVNFVRREYPEVEVIQSDVNLGFGRAHNLALKRAKGEFVMFLNPDACVTTEAIDSICLHFRRFPEIGGIGCAIQAPDGKIEPLMVQSFAAPFVEFAKLFTGQAKMLRYLGINLPLKDSRVSGEVLKLSGACLTIRRSILERIGGFDERFFMYCEDGELCQRVIEAGWKLFYLANVHIMHNQGSCSRKARKGFPTLMVCESYSKYIQKYFGTIGAFKYRMLMLVGSIIRLTIALPLFVACVLARRSSLAKWRTRCFKSWLILNWSCGFKRAVIPD